MFKVQQLIKDEPLDSNIEHNTHYFISDEFGNYLHNDNTIRRCAVLENSKSWYQSKEEAEEALYSWYEKDEGIPEARLIESALIMILLVVGFVMYATYNWINNGL
ncbi:MAG: hypothetical protein GQ570_08515 [Helicobacteraceae bacterium]|nr:hypothetical protein [Helicobacteraceae bacterium]